MKNTIAILSLTALLTSAATQVQAGQVSVSLGFPLPIPIPVPIFTSRVVHEAPQAVHVQSAPVVCAQPVARYCAPAPVVVYAPPVYYAPAPRYYGPAFGLNFRFASGSHGHYHQYYHH